MKLAIITSHPIQYNSPLFALLANESKVDVMVFYTWGEASINEKFDPDFQQNFKWDIPLLTGYNYRFIKNTSPDPGSHHFKGIINPDLNQQVEKWGADVVWIWGWSFDSHLKAIRYFKNKKEVWFRGDSTLLDESQHFNIKKILRRIFLKWVYSHIDKAFYVGTNNKEYFKKHGLNDSQLIYSPHAIDNCRFADPTGHYSIEAKKFRSKLNITDDQKVILFSGKLETKKNPFFMFQLLKQLPLGKFVLLIVGSGPLENELKEKAPRNCIFLGFQNQSKMPIIYRMADLFVLPSIGPGESWGLSINEALACGIKVIASNKCGGAVDMLTNTLGYILSTPISINPHLIEYLYDINKEPINPQELKEKLDTHSYKTTIHSVLKSI